MEFEAELGYRGGTAELWLSGECDAAAGETLRRLLDEVTRSACDRLVVHVRDVAAFAPVVLRFLAVQQQCAPGIALSVSTPCEGIVDALRRAGLDSVVTVLRR
ncbi:STAS domain-containing protein [Saccharopolyspora rosea]|uniref:STAS domain-containing protein n=1 Tax=Saccharopolyspora rosea TaxID=524884 RepID=A0ABW3FZS2_9PSEU|nr:hypothetical protein [Saccharopolyspora rosea]